MAGETEEQGPGRRRHAATIDLTATEVASDRPAETEPVAAGEAPIAPSAPADAAVEPGVQSAASDEGATASEAHTGDAPPPPPPSEPPARARSGPGFFRLVGAGLVGGVLALLAGAAGLKVLNPGGDETSALTARVAAIELRLSDLAAQASAPPAGISDLGQRIAKLESAASAPRSPGAGPDPAVGARLGAAEAAQKSLGDQVAGLARRVEALTSGLGEARDRADAAARTAASQTLASSDVAAEKAEVERLTARMTALEGATKALQDQLAKPPPAPADRIARLAVLASALKNAVDRGESFAPELAALRPLVDARLLAPLEPFAAKGVPGAAVLSRELSMLAPAMMRAANPGAPEPGMLEKLQAHAERLIRIRPVTEVQGDDSDAVIARMELRASQGDVAAALSEIAKLPEAARAPAEDWVKRAKAREAALAVSNRIAGDAFAALAKAGS